MNTRLENTVVRIAFDAMGGYNAPQAVVKAAARASLEHSFHCVLVGDGSQLDPLLQNETHNPEKLSIHHAAGVISLGSRPDQALGGVGDTSIERAAALLGSDQVDALVTAGNAGVATLAIKRHVPMLQGIRRAAIAAVIPTPRRRGAKKDPFCLLLDVGASVHTEAEDLSSFAVMGAAYARCISENPRPTVALLSVVRAHRLLAGRAVDEHFEFIGNIEGHQLLSGEADVVVCDGFTGNITVRLLEGMADAAVDIAKAAYEKKLSWRLGLSMLSGGLEQLRRLTDWEQYGGAPLLGFQKPVLVTHSGSGERALVNAARVAARAVREGLVAQIQGKLG